MEEKHLALLLSFEGGYILGKFKLGTLFILVEYQGSWVLPLFYFEYKQQDKIPL